VVVGQSGKAHVTDGGGGAAMDRNAGYAR